MSLIRGRINSIPRYFLDQYPSGVSIVHGEERCTYIQERLTDHTSKVINVRAEWVCRFVVSIILEFRHTLVSSKDGKLHRRPIVRVVLARETEVYEIVLRRFLRPAVVFHESRVIPRLDGHYRVPRILIHYFAIQHDVEGGDVAAMCDQSMSGGKGKDRRLTDERHAERA